MAVPIKERHNVLIKLNGVGGVYPDEKISVGQVIGCAYSLDGVEYVGFAKGYPVINPPADGRRIVAYMMIKLDEEDIPKEEPK